MSQTTEAKRSWLSEFLGITLPWENAEEPQEPEAASDPRAVQAANDLINLHGEAVSLGLELGGQREVLKAQVQQQILDGQYDAAEAGIGTLRDALGQARQDKAAWDSSPFADAAKQVDALASDGDPKAGELQAEQQRLAALAAQQQFKPAADAVPAFAAAVKARRDLYPARKDWLAGVAQREATMAQADEAISWGADLAAGKARLTAMATEATDEANNYAALIAEHTDIAKAVAEAHAKVKADRENWLAAASQLDTVEKNVEELTKAAAADAGTHKAALDKVKADAAKPDFAAALKGLEELAPLVAASLANAQAKTDYEAQRKALADDEAAVLRIGDTPPELKALKDTYLASVATTKESVDKGEFANAVASLTQLKVDLKAALGAKRTGIEAATRAKVDDAKAKLGASGTGGKKVWADVGSDAWKAAVDQILTVQLDEDFVARYDTICGQVADDLAKDPIVQEGFKKWSTWTKNATSLAANADKIEEVMKKVLELQSKQLGLDPPTPVGTYSNPSKPGDCGGFTAGEGIKLNSSSGDFGDFKELLDTLTHENAHAYQEKLINDLRAGTINPGDPDYNAAMALELNDNTGYVSPSESKEFRKKDPSKNPYMDQVCEVQAWRAGRMAGQEAFKKLKAG